MKPPRLTDPAFRYVRADKTDIRVRFRAEYKRLEAEAARRTAPVVQPIRRQK